MPLNCGKGLKPRLEHGVTCTSICLVLRSFTVENQLAELLFLNRPTSTFQSLKSFIPLIFSMFNAHTLSGSDTFIIAQPFSTEVRGPPVVRRHLPGGPRAKI